MFVLMNKNVLVFTPTYDELGNIEFWLELVISQGDLDILVVDDSSRDGTTELLRVKARQVPRLKLIVREGKTGVGSAHQDALKFAVEKGYDLLITLDADLSHDPRDINRFINVSEGANYIVGTRSNGGRNELTGIRWMLSKGANLMCRLMIPTGLTEYTTSYRCYDRKAMLFMASNPPKGDGYSYFIEATDMLYRSGLKLAEIPIVFRDRLNGNSKIPNLQAFKSCKVILKLTFKRVTRKRSRNYQYKL